MTPERTEMYYDPNTGKEIPLKNFYEQINVDASKASFGQSPSTTEVKILKGNQLDKN